MLITMSLKIPAIMSWSGGKDSAYTLYKVLEESIYDVKYLISTFNGNTNRLSTHSIPQRLIEEQALQTGITLIPFYVNENNNVEYEKEMGKILSHIKGEGISHIIFGDIFLQDLRRYREDSMKGFEMQCVFPVWQTDTLFLVKDFIAKGFKSITCCINENYLTREWVGREIDEEFIAALPATVDPCGENGEFHSFCYEGPVFKNSLPVKKGLIFHESLPLITAGDDGGPSDIGFWYCQIGLVSVNTKHEIKTCPRCSGSFECKTGDVANCQCNAIKLNEEVYDLIKNKYDDCLCANCLKALSHPQQLFKEKYGSHPH